MTVLRVFLVVCVLVVVGASADASASSTATGTWTLDITFAGTGTGLVTSIPAGILCTNENPETPEGAIAQPLGTCSAQFPVGVAPWVIATPSGGAGSLASVFGGFANTCPPAEHQPGVCQAGGPVTVTFNPKPIPCTVAHVIGHPLAQAKRDLRDSGCNVGTVRYAYSSFNISFGDVISQNPKPHWQRQHGAVDLVVSKGKRGP